jgi:hypothetical protein
VALADHKHALELRMHIRRMRSVLPEAYGQFLADLAPWSWFVNPITFRGDAPYSDPAVAAVEEWLADLQPQAGKPIGWVTCGGLGRTIRSHPAL